MDWDKLKGKATARRRKKVPVVHDASLQERLSDLVDQRRRAEDADRRAARMGVRMDYVPQAPQVDEQIAALQEQIEAAATWWTFESVGRADLARIVDEHRVRGDDGEPTGEVDDRLNPALIAATLVEVDGEPVRLTRPQAQELWDEAPRPVVETLSAAAWEVCSRSDDIPFSLPGTGQTPGSGQSLTTAPNEGSHIPGS